MTNPMFIATTFALAATVIAASAMPASAGLFRNKERQASSGAGITYLTPGQARRAKRQIYDEPMILNNRVYPGMRFEPPNSAFFGGNPMIGPSSW
ncbi:hypothetical protein [Methyloligella solikamskensis]|uniref:Uncharacterized protein n=1 Tax=Methyloligella solikamskensis TaxID=1177756 RepID=A0ABW3J9E9_9HYPH